MVFPHQHSRDSEALHSGETVRELLTHSDNDPLHDQMTAEGMTDNYYLTGKTVEILLGEPLHTLIARGREQTCFTLRQLRDRLRLMSGE
jgi:hypothetical protein